MAKKKTATKATAKRDEDTEKLILEAACRVFIRRGTAGARMQEIAREAGVNQALLHYYFRSKERLSVAVFGLVAGKLFPALIQVLGSDASLEEKVESLIGLYLENLSRSPFIPGYLLSEMHHHPDRLPQLLKSALGADAAQILGNVLGKLQSQINAEVKAGRMSPITPQAFAVNLISLCIFPFAARPMLSFMFGMDDAAFADFIERRKKTLPAFYKRALLP